MWAFLGSDVLFFGTLIATHLVYRGRGLAPHEEIFDIPITSVSTFVLLMSSLAMVLALSNLQQGKMGSARSWLAATEPWDYSTRTSADAEALQRLCMEVALEAISEESAVVGAFLWKWFPGDRIPRNFAMSSPAMHEVIGAHWAAYEAR